MAVPATMVQLLALPSGRAQIGQGAVPTLTKSAPYFQPLDTEVVELGTEHVELANTTVELHRQLIDGEVYVIEARWTLDDVASATASARRLAVQQALRAAVGLDSADADSIFEEYATVCIKPSVKPDDFVAEHESELASLLRQEARAVSRDEASRILASRVRYSDQDLAIVDWDGALVIDSSGDFSSDLALLTLGNAQLVQYRMLDRQVDRRLRELRTHLAERRRLGPPRRTLRAVLQTRLDLLLDYEKVEQLLLLIGDWYTAELYRTIVDEFYIEEWKAAVRAKLDELQTIADSANANLAVSWQQLIDLAQLAGWALLLVGYFVLFWLEVRRR